MKKKIWIPILSVILLAVLVIPIPTGVYKDGGTRVYSALTYKVVDWNRLIDDGDTYNKTKVYFFPKNYKSVDELWQLEEPYAEHNLIATIIDISGTTVTVQPVESSILSASYTKITFDSKDLEQINAETGDTVQITYKGAIMESYPAQINATSWKLSDDLRHLEYTEKWIDKSNLQKQNDNLFRDIVITKIYSNCFFARTVIPQPYEIKLNGTLDDQWCVGDQVICTYENTYRDSETDRIEADMLTIETSSFQSDPAVAYKPVIYLYPEEETTVTVKLFLLGDLTCTYPSYENGWTVTASPDGTLTDENGQTYNYLYWEGETNTHYDLSKGFCIKGSDTARFLEDALADLGLNRREANEFIVYWLPFMENNPYNIISFQNDTYTKAAQLDVTPAPDTEIRVFMAWQSSDSYISLPNQELTAPERTGFTLVEWGGTEIK